MTLTTTWMRRAATRISSLAARTLDPVKSEWSEAMRYEAEFIEGDLSALRWSIGCLSLACRERMKWSHPTLFRVGMSLPLALWHICWALLFGWLGALSMYGLVGKMLYPGSVGLWLDMPLNAHHRYEAASDGLLPVRVGHDHVIFGLPYAGTAPTEILGPWFVLLTAALLLFAIWAGRRSLLAALRATGWGFAEQI